MRAVVALEEADSESEYILTKACPLDRVLYLILAAETSGVVEDEE
jgi:hypothetical protein